MFELNERVQLENDEGLDLPEEELGQYGTITEVMPETWIGENGETHESATYIVTMDDGTEVACASYHMHSVK